MSRTARLALTAALIVLIAVVYPIGLAIGLARCTFAAAAGALDELLFVLGELEAWRSEVWKARQ